MHIPLRFGLSARTARIPRRSRRRRRRRNDRRRAASRRAHATWSSSRHRLSARSLSLNRGFSAPINLHFEQTAATISAHIARHDSDLFSRWQAYNTLLPDALIAACRKTLGGEQPALRRSPDRRSAGSIAADETLEPAFRAQTLALPGEADIAREIGSNIDPDAIQASRERWSRRSPRPTGRFSPHLCRELDWTGRVQPGRGERRTPGAAQHAARLSRVSAEGVEPGRSRISMPPAT